MSRERFNEFIQQALLTLPQALKLLLRISEDPDLPDEGRLSAAGAVIHWLSASNTIPGFRGILGQVDDVLVTRLVLEKLESLALEEMTRFREDTPEILSTLSEDLAVIRGFLGDKIQVLERSVETLEKLKFKGRTAEQCVLDDEAANWFYEEVQAALVDLDLEEDEVSRALKGLDEALQVLQQRVS